MTPDVRENMLVMRIATAQGCIAGTLGVVIPPYAVAVPVKLIAVAANGAARQIEQIPHREHIAGGKGNLPFHLSSKWADALGSERAMLNGRELIL